MMNRVIPLITLSLSVLLSGCGSDDDKKSDSQPSSVSSVVISSSASQVASIRSSSSIVLSSSSMSRSSLVSSSSVSSSSSLVSSSSAGVSVSCATEVCENQNKALVLKVYDEIINKKEFDLVENLFDMDLKLHIEGANSGYAAEEAHIKTLDKANSDFVATVKHVGADGDYVAVYWHLSTTPANEFSGKAVIDLYKLASGKIVDHWHLTGPVHWGDGNTASGNSVFSSLYQYSGTPPVVSPEAEAANKALVTTTYLAMFNEKNTDILKQNIIPDYIQHNRFVPNGRDALENFVNSLQKGNQKSFFVTISDADLVWTFERHSENKNLTLFDIFRVDNSINKIVEHWDLFE
jgi:predicted SnoaL-like aldol condensation-catalyzing enzyme